jgi:hypothetical protein
MVYFAISLIVLIFGAMSLVSLSEDSLINQGKS